MSNFSISVPSSEHNGMISFGLVSSNSDFVAVLRNDVNVCVVQLRTECMQSR